MAACPEAVHSVCSRGSADAKGVRAARCSGGLRPVSAEKERLLRGRSCAARQGTGRQGAGRQDAGRKGTGRQGTGSFSWKQFAGFGATPRGPIPVLAHTSREGPATCTILPRTPNLPTNIILLTLLDSNFPGNPLWAWESHL